MFCAACALSHLVYVMIRPIPSLQVGTVGIGRSVGGSIGQSVGWLTGRRVSRQAGTEGGREGALDGGFFVYITTLP